ncbi:MAG: amidohydrolase [Alphaproteobacteria bacterium]|nr:amidohydrolase [Alphaproteobacteria bacterium]
MPVINRVAALHDEMTAWRHELHAHPELAFEEHKTADFVAKKLAEFGIAVHRGLAGTGVVGSLKGRPGGRAIALRADMDALPILEANDVAHRSTAPGVMHACGHDGHTTMLLGAAKHLAETKNFTGTVHFVFQPAEEAAGGGRVMVEQGLFREFPAEAVYGMHNWPGLPAGQFGVRAGAVMASLDVFDIEVKGRGSHGAMPNHGVDPIVAAAQIVSALQSIASRNADPVESAVVSVTQIHGGDAYNVIPDVVKLAGTTRTLKPAVRDLVEKRLGEIARAVGAGMGCEVSVKYDRRYPSTINTEAEAIDAFGAAKAVAGEANVLTDLPPSMGSEDFAFMLGAKPGCYVWLGNGPREGGCVLHNAHYDFNDAILPAGASYWVTLVEQKLA